MINNYLNEAKERLDPAKYKLLPGESAKDYTARIAQYHRDTTTPDQGDKGAPPGETISQRDDRRIIKKSKRKPKNSSTEKPQNSSTEYEGTSLSEQADYIDWFLENANRVRGT